MTDLPFGTTPLPTSSSGSPVHVFLDLDTIFSSQQQLQQPQTTQIASFEASPCIGHGLDVNSHFLLYAVKNGLIRVLHRTAPLRELLRGHKNQTVQDIRFFQDGDILGTVGTSISSSSVLIWRVFERSPEIQADILLEIRAPFVITRIVWHPFDPNQFWMLHASSSANNNSTIIGTLVETTRIKTTTTQGDNKRHAVCEFFSPTLIMDGAVQVQYENQDLVDLCWSDRETKLVLTAFTHAIVLWDLKTLVPSSTNNSNAPTILSVISCDPSTEPPLSRCLFLPHENAAASSNTSSEETSSTTTWTSCFVTGSDHNSRLTLWSAFGPTSTPPTIIQVVTLDDSNSSKTSSNNNKFLVECCFGPAPADASPPSCFLVVADCVRPRLLALHCQATWNSTSKEQQTTKKQKPYLVGCDYVVPFTTQDPTYSMKCMTVPTTDLSEEELVEQGGLIFDMKVFAYQAKNTQCLTLTSYMCLPPESTFVDPTPGVKLQRLWDVHSTHVSDVGIGEGDDEDELSQELSQDDVGILQYDEEYDVDEDDEDEDDPAINNKDLVDAPEPSALPPPQGFVLKSENAAAATTATTSQSLSSNPFANWLGAIAAKSSGTTIPASAPPPPQPPGLGLVMQQQQPQKQKRPQPPPPASSSEALPPPPRPPPPVSQAFLSPMDILGTKPNTATSSRTSKAATPSIIPTIAKNPKDTPPAALSSSQQQQQPFAILSRSTPASATKPTTIPATTPPGVGGRGAESGTIGSTTSTGGGVDSDVIRAVVREELQAVILPQLQESWQTSLTASLQPLQASLDALRIESMNNNNNNDQNNSGGGGKGMSSLLDPEAIADAVDGPLRAAVASQVKVVWIPALESLTNQVLAQVSTRLEQATIDMNANTNKNNCKELEAISTQLSTMTALVTQLTNEVQSLRATVAAQQQATAASASSTAASAAAARKSPPPASTPENVAEAMRKEILALLREKRYEAAFTKAVSASSYDMTVYCCSNADIHDVLGGTSASLSQPILLCLMQQLGTVLSSPKSNIQLELEWLQEIALSLNASDAQIHMHVPSVLQQLVAGINNRMAQQQQQGDPSSSRRSLQRLLQVLRGMQMG